MSSLQGFIRRARARFREARIDDLHADVSLPRFISSDPSVAGASELDKALAALGFGGKLQIRAETYDISALGSLDAAGKHLVGGGWNHEGGGTVNGTYFDGKGAAGPLVDSRAPASHEGGSLEDFAVKHTEGSTYAIINDLIDGDIRNVMVDLDGQGGGGFKAEGESFFTRFEDCFVRNVPGGAVGYEITGKGFAHALHDCRQNAIDASDAVGVLIRCQSGDDGPSQADINGGQFSGGTNAGGAGVRWVNENSSPRQGGTVRTTVEKANVAFDINADGTGISNSFNRVLLNRPKFTTNNVSTGAKFGDTTGSVLYLPDIPSPGDGGDFAEWTANSAKCLAVVDPNTMINGAYTVASGAYLPHIRVPYAVDNGTLSGFVTDPEITIYVDYNISENSDVAWDGSNWYNFRTNSTFAP